MSQVTFYNPWNHPKTSGFMMFSGGMESVTKWVYALNIVIKSKQAHPVIQYNTVHNTVHVIQYNNSKKHSSYQTKYFHISLTNSSNHLLKYQILASIPLIKASMWG